MNLQTIVDGDNHFALDLYRELKEGTGNLFFSPYSLSTALAMTYVGARGQTREEMAEVLHLPLEAEEVDALFAKLRSQLNIIHDKGRVELSVANSLWVQKGYTLLDDFIKRNEAYYGSGLNFVDFAKETEAARETINTRVANDTRQRVKELIKSGKIGPLTTLLLCNAIYFKGNWLSRFDKSETADAGFNISVDTSVAVPMMNQKSLFRFKNFGAFSALELPYEGWDLSMLVFLPKEVGGLAGFEKKLTNANVRNWIRQLSSIDMHSLHVSMPGFKAECEFDLANVFLQMGMPHAFTDADFSGMTGDTGLAIGKIVHKAVVEVNEEGSVSAAASYVAMIRSEPPAFCVDHPFVFMIHENRTGSILFMGRIVNPLEK
ncbi:MAG: serpin family protein [bacterium]|nr:serpin family protein [bacterium]